MPAAILYISDPNNQEMRSVEEAFEKERHQRNKRTVTNWNAYNGDMKKPLKEDSSTPGLDDNIVLPLIATLIDKSISSIQGVDDSGVIDGIQIEVADQEPDSPPQLYLDVTLEVNRWNHFLQNLLLSSAISGHGFILLEPEGRANPYGGPRLTRLVNLNPVTVSVFWDEADAERVLWYRVQTGNDAARRYDYVDRGGSWEVLVYERTMAHGQWKAIEDMSYTWNYSWSPIIDYQNLPTPLLGGYYGRDDVGNLLALNHALNFAVSNMQRIIKHHAHPKTVVTGATLDTVDDSEDNAPDRLLEFASPDAKVYNVEMQSDGVAAFSQVQFLLRQLFNSGRQLDPSTVADKLGDLTNFGLRVMYHDVLARRQEKLLTVSEALEVMCQHVLELGGFGANLKIQVIPPDPLPEDDMIQASALAQDVQVFGLSPDTALERRGYDPEAERERRANTRAERVSDQSAVNAAGALATLQAEGRRIRRGEDNGRQIQT